MICGPVTDKNLPAGITALSARSVLQVHPFYLAAGAAIIPGMTLAMTLPPPGSGHTFLYLAGL